MNYVYKYLTILSLSALALVACGKQVKNSDPNAERFVNRSPALGASEVKLLIGFDDDGGHESDIYKFQADAWLTIPEHVLIESGTPLHFTVRIFFNTEAPDSVTGGRELFCEYRNAKQIGEEQSFDGYYHNFVGCFEDVDGDGSPEVINYHPGTQVAQDQDRYVRLEYVDGFTDEEAQVYSTVEIDWF